MWHPGDYNIFTKFDQPPSGVKPLVLATGTLYGQNCFPEGQTFNYTFFINTNLQREGWPSLDNYIAAIEVCSRPLPSLHLTSPHVVRVKGPADEGLDIVDVILPVEENDDFLLLVEGKVVRWAESKSFSCGTYLIKPTTRKELPTLSHFFKELGNDDLLIYFHSLK
jgi:hypothetical protein